METLLFGKIFVEKLFSVFDKFMLNLYPVHIILELCKVYQRFDSPQVKRNWQCSIKHFLMSGTPQCLPPINECPALAAKNYAKADNEALWPRTAPHNPRPVPPPPRPRNKKSCRISMTIPLHILPPAKLLASNLAVLTHLTHYWLK